MAFSHLNYKISSAMVGPTFPPAYNVKITLKECCVKVINEITAVLNSLIQVKYPVNLKV